MIEKLVINVEDPTSIRSAINRIETIKKRLERVDEYTKRLADIGVKVATEAFTSALSNPDFTSSVSVTAIPDGNGGYVIRAEGDEVAFIEFGTGVYYNGSGSYPGDLPAGVSKIGDYGQGKGSRRAWGYYAGGDKSNLVITHGHYRSAGMYNAEKAMAEEAVSIIKEIFA